MCSTFSRALEAWVAGFGLVFPGQFLFATFKFEPYYMYMSVIDDYLQGVAEPQKAALERVRGIVRSAVPDAEEVISYGMPAFKYKKKYLIGFAAFADHVSLFPTPGPIAALKDKLSEFKLAKGTIQFTSDNPVPEPLIKELLRIRLTEITK